MSDSELKQDVKEIKTSVVELVKQGAVHNHMLKEHEARSLAIQQEVRIKEKELEHRLTPIEGHVRLVGTILKYGGAVLIGVVIQYIARNYL